MKLNSMKKIFKFYRWFTFSFFIMMNGCVLANNGERFGIGIASNLNDPRLEYAILINDEHTIRVDGTGSHVGFGASNDVVIPDEIEFLWRAVGEKVPHSEKMKLRSRIPERILQKINGTRPMFSLNLEFFVINNAPKFRWDVTRFHVDHSPAEEIERGGDW
jgi:hypothetical protein